MRTLLILALAAGVTALTLGSMGCGSSGGTDSASGESAVPKALYVQKGDRICQANYAKRTRLLVNLRKQFANGTKLPTQADQEQILVNQIMPIFWEESKELNALPPPGEGAEEAKEILAALERSIEGVEADPAKSLSAGTGVEFKEAEQLAHEYGFKWCGRS